MQRVSIIFLISFVFPILAKERIAILAYGSLIRRPSHSITGAHLRASEFRITPIIFPISLSLLENKNRITAVIDNKYGSPKRVWFAISDFKDIHHSIQNLAAREGAPQLQNNQYDSRYISYLRKAATTKKIHEQEQFTDNANWVSYDSQDQQQKLDAHSIKTIIAWAEKNNFDVVLWVSCPIVAMNKTEFISHLLENPTTLKNAQHYISLLPDGPQTELENAILNGRQSLKRFMQVRKNSVN